MLSFTDELTHTYTHTGFISVIQKIRLFVHFYTLCVYVCMRALKDLGIHRNPRGPLGPTAAAPLGWGLPAASPLPSPSETPFD